jgi:hypothetical protein
LRKLFQDFPTKRTEQDRRGLKSTVFHIPSTKAAPVYGEDVSWSAQAGPTDPEAAIALHFQVNNPPAGGALFAYRFKDGHRPLTKPKFMETLAKAARDAGLDPRQGHGIRIGSTLEYLHLVNGEELDNGTTVEMVSYRDLVRELMAAAVCSEEVRGEGGFGSSKRERWDQKEAQGWNKAS